MLNQWGKVYTMYLSRKSRVVVERSVAVCSSVCNDSRC